MLMLAERSLRLFSKVNGKPNICHLKQIFKRTIVQVSEYFVSSFYNSCDSLSYSAFEDHFNSIFSLLPDHFSSFSYLANEFIMKIYQTFLLYTESFVFSIKPKRSKKLCLNLRQVLEQIEDFFIQRKDSHFGIEWQQAQSMSRDLFYIISIINEMPIKLMLSIIKEESCTIDQYKVDMFNEIKGMSNERLSKIVFILSKGNKRSKNYKS